MQIDAVSTLWVLVSAVLVFLMIPAIGMLEAGLIRRKNVVNGLMKGLLAVVVFFPVWYLVYPLWFSDVVSAGYLETGDGVGIPWAIAAFFLGAFGAVTLALVFAGAPERVKFAGWLVYAVFFSAVQWPLVAWGVWGGGFLAALGDITGIAPGYGLTDFAGGTVVHAYAGVASLAILLAIGPTVRRIALNGSRVSAVRVSPELMYRELIESRSMELPLAVIGTSLLFFGWFGFNGGSTITLSEQTQYAIANTVVAGALAGLVALLISRARKGVWDPVMAISGIIGGLVMITPMAGFVDVATGFVIGVLAGVVTYAAFAVTERFYVVDDPVGSFPVHGVNGIIGSALVPVLAKPGISGLTGLVYGGSPAWLAVQLMGMFIALVFVFATTLILFKILVKFGLRATIEEELVGLDTVDHGIGVEARP